MPRHSQQRRHSPGQRQLRVGEEIRHALSDVFMRGECHDPELDGVSITVSEVRISPDLKNASVYVMPLAGAKTETIIAVLERLAPTIRTLISHKMRLRYTPRLNFRLDTSFEEATRIHTLLRNPAIARDLELSADEDASADDER